MLYRDPVTPTDVDRLLSVEGTPCVSMFLPTHRITQDTEKDKIVLRNMRSEAAEKLGQMGLRRPDIEETLAIVDEALEDESFWPYLSDGLAIFANAGESRLFRVALPFEPQLFVAERFRARPLIPLFSGDGTFLLVALSRNEVAVFEGTRGSLQRIAPENMPRSMSDALKIRQRPSMSTGGREEGHELQKSLYQAFFRQVDRALKPLYGEFDTIVAAGVDFLLPIFREVCSHPRLAGGITGNPFEVAIDDLHAEAWALAAEQFKQPRLQALEHFQQNRGTGRTSTDLAEIIWAGKAGRVETLFVRDGAEAYGRIDDDAMTVDIHAEEQAGDNDLVARAVRNSFSTGASMFSGTPPDIPDCETVAALFRY